jgi:hypothetical protein
MKSIPSIFSFKDHPNIDLTKITVGEDYTVIFENRKLPLDKNMNVNINEIKVPFVNLFTLAYFSDLLLITCDDIKDNIKKVFINPVTDLVVQIKDNKDLLNFNNLIISSLRYNLELNEKE